MSTTAIGIFGVVAGLIYAVALFVLGKPKKDEGDSPVNGDLSASSERRLHAVIDKTGDQVDRTVFPPKKHRSTDQDQALRDGATPRSANAQHERGPNE